MSLSGPVADRHYYEATIGTEEEIHTGYGDGHGSLVSTTSGFLKDADPGSTVACVAVKVSKIPQLAYTNDMTCMISSEP